MAERIFTVGAGFADWNAWVPPADRFTQRFQATTDASDWLRSTEAWPAAGGGLLLGLVAPTLHGTAPRRRSIKSLFLKIDPAERVSVILPYVRLEPDVQGCVADLVSATLGLFSDEIVVDNGLFDPESDLRPNVVDLCPASEAALGLLAAVGGALLRMAAAERWGIPPGACVLGGGFVNALGRRSLAYADLAGDASLLGTMMPLPWLSDRAVESELPFEEGVAKACRHP